MKISFLACQDRGIYPSAAPPTRLGNEKLPVNLYQGKFPSKSSYSNHYMILLVKLNLVVGNTRGDIDLGDNAMLMTECL